MIERRNEATRIDRDLAEQSKTASTSLAAARLALDVLETDLALADASGDEAQLAKLGAARPGASERVQVADAALERAERARRGLAARRKAIDSEIEVSASTVAGALHEIQRAALAALREDLRRAIIGEFPGGLAAALRGAHMLRAAVRVPNEDMLSEIRIRDPLSPGAPVLRLIDGAKNYSAAREADFENLSEAWREVPELRALFDQLAPIALLEREFAAISRQVRDVRQRELLAAPPKPQPAPQRAPQPDVARMSNEEYRAYRASQVNASRTHPPFDPAAEKWRQLPGQTL
ncbi:MAG TPA: hypothetical protein VN808_08180 [Stellaceae bacterium]|nr:hypothetical protein [Stellaceae bacterium]